MPLKISIYLLNNIKFILLFLAVNRLYNLQSQSTQYSLLGADAGVAIYNEPVNLGIESDINYIFVKNKKAAIIVK